ncbi:hypothetical protein [Streptomyces inhibens]|uniref:hypothetical protein n=1 Tax=Streptomyces inhibens TaxID=2293571 RepID=UPI001FD2A350|nr:hypothetical protein [Streptomyces inhibens]
MLVLRGALAPEVRDRAGEAALRLVATDRTAGRDRSVDGKDGFRGVVALDDAERRPGSLTDHPTLTAHPRETGP